jgi:hypothetical protein
MAMWSVTQSLTKTSGDGGRRILCAMTEKKEVFYFATFMNRKANVRPRSVAR